MSMFSGITVALHEDNSFELNMADVRMEFDESFRVLNGTAVEFDQWCAALDRLSQLNQEIEQHDGKADKALIMFLNQNNELANALGVDLSLENWDEEAKGAEIQQGYSMAMEGLWEAIKNFFKNIWDGIKNFWEHFKDMFRGTKAKLEKVANDPKCNQKIQAAAENASKGNDKGPKKSEQAAAAGKNVSSKSTVAVIKPSAIAKKLQALGLFVQSFQQLDKTDFKSAIEGFKNIKIDEFASEFHMTRNGFEWSLGGSIFAPEDIEMSKKTVAENVMAAGWNAQSLNDLVRSMIVVESLEQTTKVIEGICSNIINTPEDKFPSDANPKESKAMARLMLLPSKLASLLAKILHAIGNDLVAIVSSSDIAKDIVNDGANGNQAPRQLTNETPTP